MNKGVLSFLVLIVLVVASLGYSYEDWRRQRDRAHQQGSVSLHGRRANFEGGHRRRDELPAGRRHRGRWRQDSDEDEAGERLDRRREFGGRGRHGHSSRLPSLDAPDLESESRWRRLMRRVHHMHDSLSFDALPVITGHVELGPGFAFDWDLDIDGLFEGDVEWWKGPNVCVREEVEEVNRTEVQEGGSGIFRHHYQFFTTVTCESTDSSYSCTTEAGLRDRKRKTTKIYECCHGFERNGDSPGCTRAVELQGLLETAESLGGSEFVDAVEGTGFEPRIDNGNFTLFLPVNTSLDSFMPNQVPAQDMDVNVVIVSPELVSMATNVRETVASHIVEGFVRSSRFTDEMLLETENSESSIRINVFSTPKRLVTANCRVVTSSDHLATNGIVHTLSAPLPVVSGTIWETLRKAPDFHTFVTLLERTGLDALLKKPGQLTILAPTNEAFSNMVKEERQKLLMNDGCMKNVLTNHVLPNVICSSIIQGHTRSDNLLNKSLNLTRTPSGELYVEHARMSALDIMAANGVIHVIDQVVVPDEARSIREVVEKAGHNKFFGLIHEAGLSKEFAAQDNVTLFVPTDQAIQDLADEAIDGVSEDTEALAKMLRFHMVPREIGSEDFLSNEKLETIASEKKISVNQYYSHPFRNRDKLTVQCANVVETDIKVCEGTVHFVDKVLLPPRGDVLDILYQDEQFSRLVATLKEIGMAEELQTTQADITIFAPTNHAFEELEEQESIWAFLQQHPDIFKQVLRHHVVTGSMCCSGVYPTRWFIHPREHTVDGSTVVLHRRGEEVFINRIPVQSCDIAATNGVVHALDDFLTESLRKYVPIRPGRGHRGRNFWERLEGLFGYEQTEVEDLIDADLYWDERK